MARVAVSTEDFLSANREAMISCPHQPGNLKISRKACLKRQKAAQQRKAGLYQAEDLFHYFISQGLIRCQRCTILRSTGH